MAGKNGTERYKILDACLRDQNRNWSKEDLLEKVNKKLIAKYGEENKITIHTIRHDLNTLRDTFDAPVELYKIYGKYFYRYSNPEYSFFKIELKQKDISTLTLAMETLSNIKGLELSEEVKPIIAYLQNKTVLGNSNSKILQFDHKPIASGTEHLEDLLSSIQQKTVIKIKYHPYKNTKKINLNFHPYLLKEYNSRWFCLGYDSITNRIMLLALDRINNIDLLSNENWVENNFIDINTYFDPIIGVTRNEDQEIELVVLEFSAHRFPYVKSKKIHPSQEILEEKEDGSGKLSIKVMYNNELVSSLLGFGSDIKIISPLKLKNEILAIINKMEININN